MLDSTQASLKTLAAQGGFGDLNKFPTEALTEMIRHKLIRLIPRTEEGVNIRLTQLGRTVAKVL